MGQKESLGCDTVSFKVLINPMDKNGWDSYSFFLHIGDEGKAFITYSVSSLVVGSL